jgi:hypothetical protein
MVQCRREKEGVRGGTMGSSALELALRRRALYPLSYGRWAKEPVLVEGWGQIPKGSVPA